MAKVYACLDRIGSGFQSTTSVSTEFQGTMQGGVLEGMIGETWSTEGWGGFATMMAAYEKQMNVVSAPGLGVRLGRPGRARADPTPQLTA